MNFRPQDFLSSVENHIWAIVAMFGSLIGAALLALTRDQLRVGMRWLFDPITRLLPWNRIRAGDAKDDGTNRLKSTFTLVDVVIRDIQGTRATYRKVSSFRVLAGDVTTYKEGVAAEGHADNFLTMRGSILSTVAEHGFYLSTIALPEPTYGSFVNLYQASLYDCFKREKEHWTQEIAFPTDVLALQIHFPPRRPPITFSCEVVVGTEAKPATTSAQMVELSGCKSLVWNVEAPRVGSIFKLSWAW